MNIEKDYKLPLERSLKEALSIYISRLNYLAFSAISSFLIFSLYLFIRFIFLGGISFNFLASNAHIENLSNGANSITLYFNPDLIDGLTLIGLIALMSVTVCPLLMWALTFDLDSERTGILSGFRKT